MVFLDRTYSVLLVSAAEKFNESLMPLLPGNMKHIKFATDILATDASGKKYRAFLTDGELFTDLFDFS